MSENNAADLQSRVLARLYSRWYAPEGPQGLDIEEFARENGVDARAVIDALYDVPAEYCERYTGGGNITPWGIIAAESEGLADPAVEAAQNQIRIRLLEQMACVQEEYGRHASADWELIIADAGVTSMEFDANIRVLKALGWVDNSHGVRRFGLTPYGVEVVQKHRARAAIVAEFNRLQNAESITPQARGRQFEALMKPIIEGEGWHVEANVAIPGEENDLIISQGDDCYLLELKWYNKPVQPKEVDRLIRKVEKRPKVGGLFLSMSGYTENATRAVHDALTQGHLVLLLGPDSIRSVVSNRQSFNEVLQHKLNRARKRREVDAE